ncbi:extracellular solute-binding protein [Devosia ginsengisoli]|uniref:extracellular solute-binding protein n=1 Tax=Devosia ginsengisoli TaxID=400770 RepID=UPI0026EB0D8D|nr:extracellular solute-binding protein [Devosia ginsengisoli]MCR6671378.1 extracellular solute-binding protein [Devosia ginsengisoli]
MKTFLTANLSVLAAALMVSTAMGADLRILTAVTGGKDAAEHEQFVAELEKHLGLDIEMVKPASDYNNVLFTSLASGERYDLIYGDSKMLPGLVEQGALTDVTDLVAASAVLSDETAIPAGEWQLFDIEGRKWAVPNKFEGGTLPTIRQDWLEESGLDTPVTLDDWTEFFRWAKAEKDAYGLSTSKLYDIQGYMSAEGVKAGYVLVDGKRTIPYATPAAAAVYDWFGMLSKEGLLDPNFVTNGSGEFRNLFMTDRVAAVTYWDAWVGLFNNIMATDHPDSSFEAKGVSGVPGPDGEIILRRGDASLWMIPANAEHPENAIKFLEFWHSEPGYVLGTLGIEGVDYNKTADGQYELTEQGQAHGMDHGSPRVASTTWENPFPPLPGVEEAQAIIMEDATMEYLPAEWSEAAPIVEKHAFQAMLGEVTGAEAVEAMHAELLAAGLIDE